MRWFWISVGLLLAWCPVAGAQGAPVYDNANFLQNIVTAAESTITAVEAVIQTAQGVLNLTALDELATAGGIAEDMALLGQLVEQAQGLSYDLGSLESQITSLFDLGTAPDTRDGLTERLAEIKRVKFQCYTYAARVQTLMTTALRTVDHLQGLLDTLGSIVGNLSGQQTTGQFQAVTSKHLANLDVQIATYHRAQTVDKLSEALIIESINKIQARRMEDWPTP
jgi:conjugal transfer/entry exclusion protein